MHTLSHMADKVSPAQFASALKPRTSPSTVRPVKPGPFSAPMPQPKVRKPALGGAFVTVAVALYPLVACAAAALAIFAVSSTAIAG